MAKHATKQVTISTRVSPGDAEALLQRFPELESTSEILRVLVTGAINEGVEWDKAGYQEGLRRGYAEAHQTLQEAFARKRM